MSGGDPLIRVVAETGSTNEDMKALALEGVPEGTWLRAERQISGKGRMGRSWEGEAGNLFASTLVRLSPGDPAPPTLAFVAAVAVHEALTAFVGADRIRIKWPNDIMAGMAKLSGMLMERVGDAVVIGIGVNVASAPVVPGRETVSLDMLGAQGCNAETVLNEVAARFVAQLERWRTYGAGPVIRAWLERAHAAGSPLLVQLPDGGALSGHFETLDADGALILRLADGARHAIHAGDVFLL